MINLLPYNKKAAIKRTLRLRVINATLVFLLFLVAVGVLLMIPSFVSVNLRYSIAKNTYTTLSEGATFANEADITAVTADIERLKRAYGNQDTFSVLAALDTVTIPPGITVTNIAMESTQKRSISFSGISRDRATLQQFIASLHQEDAVASVDNPVSNFVKNQNGQFTVLVQFK